MSSRLDRTTVDLATIDPAGSRHQGRRSAVALTAESVVVGTADGTVRAFDRETLAHRWDSTAGDGSVVTATALPDGGVAIGERGPSGAVSVYDESGELRWQYETAADVGEPQTETRFFLPFVVDCVADDQRLYVATRRYERHGDRPEGDRRQFESVIFAFEGINSYEENSYEGKNIVWRYGTDASPISLAVRGERLAVAYNRCTGRHQNGLVVLDAEDGSDRWAFDPGSDGQRRVGDVALLAEGAVLTSHGDYRGYALDSDGEVRWQADLATPRDIDGETVYAYPNHVHATEAGVLFVTGNTYPEEGRETDVLHPEEHTAFGYTPDGDRRWTTPVGGFANGIDAHGDTVAVPCAQNFRRREPDTHACRLFDVSGGPKSTVESDGVVTAAAIDEGLVAAVEEPVVYHDEGTELGTYRLHVLDRQSV